MKSERTIVRSIVVGLALVGLLAFGAVGTASTALAVDGVWIGTGNSTWSTTTNWQGGFIADGVGATATFTAGGLGGNRTFTVDSTRTLGTLTVGENRSVHINSSGGAVLILDNNGSASQVTMASTTGQNFYIDVAFELKGDLNIKNDKNNDSSRHLNFGAITNTSVGNVTITHNAGALASGGKVNMLGIISDGTGGNGIVSLCMDNKATSTYALSLTAANTYSGSTTLTSGYLDLQNANAIRNSTLIMNGGNLIMNSLGGTTFNFGGLSATTNGVGYDIALTNSAAAAVALSVGKNNANTTYAGVLSGGGSLGKTGAGMLTLSGVNIYSGTTTIGEGELAIASAGLINNSDATINGGTLRYNSSTAYSKALTFTGGTLAGTNWNGGLSGQSIGAGKTISPGNSPGTAATIDQTWAGGGTYVWEINNATGTAGTDPGWDLLSGTGTLDITASSGSKFNINVTSLAGAVAGDAANFVPATSYSWLIADFASAITFDATAFNVNTTGFSNAFTGTFAVALGGTGAVPGDSSQVYVTYVPEPATMGLLAIGALAVLRRRRK
jgi:autotransporter-associated beta strand protein